MDTTTNKGQIYIIVCTIAVLAAACVATMCVLAYNGKEPSQGFTLLTGGLVGSLGTMLTKTTPTETIKSPLPANPNQPAPVIVTNKPDDPVPTEETKP